MKTRKIAMVGLVVLLGLIGGLSAQRLSHWWTAPRPGYCPICQRHEHGQSVVRLQAEGEGVTEVCCLSCALNYERQTSKAVTIVSVTDHETGKPLDPEGATLVVGSDVSPCIHDAGQLRLAGEALPVRWDRCLPSILAFASPEVAEAFRSRYGGRVRSLRQLRGEAATLSAPPG